MEAALIDCDVLDTPGNPGRGVAVDDDMPPDAADRPPLAPEHYLMLAGLAVVVVVLLLRWAGDYGMSFYAFGGVVELLALAYALAGFAVILATGIVMRRTLSGRVARTAMAAGVGLGLVVLFLYGFAPFRI